MSQRVTSPTLSQAEIKTIARIISQKGTRIISQEVHRYKNGGKGQQVQIFE